MKKKILFVNDEMVMGGVARILNTLLLNIDENRYDVDLLVLHKRGELLKEIPSYVNVIEGTKFFNTVDIPLKQCNLKQLFSKLRLLFYMKTGLIDKKIKKERKKILSKHYDVEFNAKEGFGTIFTAYGDSDLKINWIQVDYMKCNYSKNHMGLVKNALKEIDVNISSSKESKESYEYLFGLKNITLIHNLMDIKKVKEGIKEEVDIKLDNKKINLICVARFSKQKGIDRLIKAYAKLKDYYSLHIIGDGELKDELYSLADSLKVKDEIKWYGIQSNPYPYINKCDLFVMPSLYEGYPTITIESLLSGTPVLSTNVSGIDEQLHNPEHGWIVENSDDSIYEKLNEIKNDKKLLVEYKEKLKDYKYDNEIIMSKYYDIIDR